MYKLGSESTKISICSAIYRIVSESIPIVVQITFVGILSIRAPGTASGPVAAEQAENRSVDIMEMKRLVFFISQKWR